MADHHPAVPASVIVRASRWSRLAAAIAESRRQDRLELLPRLWRLRNADSGRRLRYDGRVS
jgi:hypothetical protein